MHRILAGIQQVFNERINRILDWGGSSVRCTSHNVLVSETSHMLIVLETVYNNDFVAMLVSVSPYSTVHMVQLPNS